MKRLIVIIHYEEVDARGRPIIASGRCLSHQGKSIPWFNVVRKVFVAAVASMSREIAQRESFLPGRAA